MGWLVLVGFFFFFFCMCIDVHVVVYIDVFPCPALSPFILYPSERSFAELGTRMPTNKPQQSSCSPSLSATLGLQCVRGHAQLSLWDYRIWTQVFMLPQPSALTYWAIFLVLFQLSKELQETERKASRKNRGPRYWVQGRLIPRWP